MSDTPTNNQIDDDEEKNKVEVDPIKERWSRDKFNNVKIFDDIDDYRLGIQREAK
jgi:hypothetical protein